MLLSQMLKRIRFPIHHLSRTLQTPASPNALLLQLSNNLKSAYQSSRNGYNWRTNHKDPRLWVILYGHAVILGIIANPVFAKDGLLESNSENTADEGDIVGLRKVDDSSVISNVHTSKWRVFTDNARDLFLQGKIEEAERFFLSALEEAKDGFGERDPHVASACNNLAELYRVMKAFDKAEPFYLHAINILEESYGPEDVRVGAAFHNLGQFYLVQRKLEEAQSCYERALRITGRVLGHGHLNYADTMYHLGTVLYLQGKEKDAEALIQDSIRILEEGGQGESILCIRRLRYLSQVYLKSGRVTEAENLQRKILHIMELSKGWNSLETINAAEGLALTLQSFENLNEAQELLERCLDARKSLLPDDHIQIGGNMLLIARVMLNSDRLRKMTVSEAVNELDYAEELLNNSKRVARQNLDKLIKQKGKRQSFGAGETLKEGRAALVVLLQALDALGRLEIIKQELKDLKENNLPSAEAENSFVECISAYQEFARDSSIVDSPEAKASYLSCLRHLSSLIRDGSGETRQSRRVKLQDLEDEIKRMEIGVSSYRKRKG